MAEEAKEPSWGILSRIRARINTLFKRGLIKAKFPVHFGPERRVENIGTYKRLQAMANFKFFEIVKDLNEMMVKAEKDWDGLKGTAFETDNADYLRDLVISLYSDYDENKHDIRSSLGPFTDMQALDEEYKCVEGGTGEPKKVDMNINLRASGSTTIPVKFSVPNEVTIRYWRGSYNVAYFGTSSPYWTQLEEDIRNICGQVKQAFPRDERVNRRVNDLETKFVAVAKHMETVASNFENEIRAALGGGSGLKGIHERLKTIRDDIMRKRLDENKVYYTHTYKVIKKLNENGELLDKAGDIVRRGGNAIKLPDNFRRPEELGPGLDKNGWPLEVGDDKTRSKAYMNGATPIPLGAVLIDIYEGRSPRMVPLDLTEDWDLLDVAVWVYVSYDAYRDDIRDARHHANAISVMEHIKAELEPINTNRIRMMSDIKQRRHQKAKMFLNKLFGTSLRPAGDPQSVAWTIESSQFNPAFDLTPIPREGRPGKSIHMGRKYYYDVQDNVEQSHEPTISSRGAALYILHRVIEETKYWGGPMSPGKAGVIEVLEAIGKQIKGYDIGPNIDFVLGKEGPEARSWGQELPINPFRPKRR